MTAAHPLPVEVLEPIASGTASCPALWEPLLGVARFHPIRLFGTDAYDVWLEAHPQDRRGTDTAVSATVVADAGAFAVHVYSPARFTHGVEPAAPAASAASPMAGCPALRTGRSVPVA